MKLYIDNGQFTEQQELVLDNAVRMICAAVEILYREDIDELLIPKHEHDPNVKDPLAEMMFNLGRDVETASHADLIVTMDWEAMEPNVVCRTARKYGIEVISMATLVDKLCDIFMKKGTAMEYEPRAEKGV